MANICVKLDGVTFTSAEELGAYLNMSPNTLLAMLHRGDSIQDIVEHNKVLWPVAERRARQTTNQVGSAHSRPCQVGGQVFPSQAAAARAYAMPIQTIYSRMRRQGLTFSEAILRGYREERMLSPIPELYGLYHQALLPYPSLDSASLEDLRQVLAAAGFPCQSHHTEDSACQAIQSSFEILDGQQMTLWLLYLPSREFLELMTPDLAPSPECLDTLNRQAANVKFWTEGGQLLASTGHPFRRTGEGTKRGLALVYRFLGACHQAMGIIKAGARSPG